MERAVLSDRQDLFRLIPGLLERHRLGLLGVAAGPALPQLRHAFRLRSLGRARIAETSGRHVPDGRVELTGMIAIITALREELSPLLKRAKIERTVRLGGRRCHVGTLAGQEVVMMAGGDGMTAAEESVEQLLQRFDVSLLIGVGIAGGVDPSLRFGDIVVASEIRFGDSTIACEPLIAGQRAVVATTQRLAHA